MSEISIIKNCSPTLAGLKTGNLFRAEFTGSDDVTRSVREYNRMFLKKGIRVIPLKSDSKGTLVYIYRISRLSKDLNEPEARKILSEKGYPESAEKCVAALSERMKSKGEFPHEIGLFLGYPAEDVRGFMEKREAKLVGCRKVYGDAEAAQKEFSRFRKCTEIYSRLYSNGRSIERLTVSG